MAMPRRVRRPIAMVFNTSALRWARQHSGGFEWDLPPSANGGRPPGPAGAASWGLAARPQLVLSRRPRHHFRMHLEHPPQRHVRKKLESFIRTNRLQLEWIAFGFTAESFWTVTGSRQGGNHVTGKPGEVWVPGNQLRLARLSPHGCLAGDPLRAAN